MKIKLLHIVIVFFLSFRNSHPYARATHDIQGGQQLVKLSYKSKLDRLSYNVFMKPSNNTQLYPRTLYQNY